jgi:hypothetical protein
MERVPAGADTIIIDFGALDGVVPDLPLNQLTRRLQNPPQYPRPGGIP